MPRCNGKHPPQLDLVALPHHLGPYVPGRGGRRKQPGAIPSCTGGCTSQHPKDGYIRERRRDHPQQVRCYVLQHRLVMETMLGRLLGPKEVVHHKNGNRADNRRCNLELMASQADHFRAHKEEDPEFRKIPLTADQVRTALDGRTTQEAAEELGVHHMTLRNRFERLLKKRTSPGGPYAADMVQRVRALAADPKVGIRAASRALGVTTRTLRKCCLRHAISWTSAPLGRPKRSA
jgi:HNH endonuclease